MSAVPPTGSWLRRVRLPFLPTRRMALVTLLVAPVWLLSATEAGLAVAVAATVLLIVVAIADALLTPGRAAVEVARRAPEVIGVGDRAEGAYMIRSRWPRAVRVELYDRLPAAVERWFGWVALDDAGDPATATTASSAPLGGDSARAAAVVRGPPPQQQDRAPATSDQHHQSAERSDRAPNILRGEPQWLVPARGTLDVPITLAGRARGVFPLGAIALRVAGPLGLVVRTVRYPSADAITVAPSLAGVRRYRLLAVQHRLRDAGVRAIRRRGSGTNFAGLREYAEGDDPRHVDWKATARRGALVSREFTVEQGQAVLIAIDAGRLMTQYAGALPRFEYALSSALVLADVAVASGDNVGLLVFDDEVRAFVPPARGRAALQRIREALVPVQATMSEPDYAAAFRTLAARHRKRALLVIFTDVIDVRASHTLIAHATRGAVRHLPLVVALRNDALVAAASPTAATSAALYTAAAAEELLFSRSEALDRMRRAGVSVVDVSPTAMTVAVVNRYLQVKGRGSL